MKDTRGDSVYKKVAWNCRTAVDENTRSEGNVKATEKKNRMPNN